MKCIYLRTNLFNGKQYVGQTNDFKQREYDWKCLKAIYANKYLSCARMKYGFDNFKVEILRECDTQKELNEWEKYYINELNTKKPNGYNLTDGGNGVSGFKHSEESKKKMSDSTKGEKHPFWGKHITNEAKYKSMINQPTRKEVYQYTLNDKLIKRYNSINEAARETNICAGEILHCCNGGFFSKSRNKWVNVKQYNGYKFSFEELNT